MNRIIAKTRAHLGSPLLLIIDDLHWCDDTSLEWLLYLARQLESQPILVVLTYRNNEIQPSLNQLLAVFDRTAFAHEVSLKRLTRAELDTMLCAIFSLAQSPRAEFLNSLYELTEGNPFFIEEVLKSLVALGDIFQVSGTWTRKRLSELQIPRTIQVAVHQRTRQLSPATQHVLTLSAVMGQRFDFSVLQALTQQSETALLQQIKDLVAAQLVIEEPALSHTEITEGTFAFRHALTREAIYSELLVRERKLLHRAIAESIEACYSSSLEAHISDLAYHCYEAGLWMQALDWSKQAGDSARRLYANSEALRHYVRARECAERLEDSEQVAPLDQIIGQVHHARGAFSQALESYACALQATSDPARRAVLKAEMGAAFVSLADERGITYLQEALRELDVETQSRETAFTMLWMGRYFHLRAQYTQALDYLQRALAGTLDDTNMYGFISSALMFSGRFEESMEWARRAVREGEAKQSWRTVAFGYIYLSTNPKVL